MSQRNIAFILTFVATLIALPGQSLAKKKSKNTAADITSEAQVTVMPSFGAPTDANDPKHKPLLDAPEKVNAGQWFPVTITIGKTTHPSLVEHHVRYISLLKEHAELARIYLHPVHTAPKVTFWVSLEESTTLRAVEEPTHAGAFYTDKKITVVKTTAKK